MSKRRYKNEFGFIVEEDVEGEEKLQVKLKYIVEEYTINECKYQILYKESVKASEVFNALNRMIVSNKDRDVQKDIQIIKIFNPVLTTLEVPKRKWWEKNRKAPIHAKKRSL